MGLGMLANFKTRPYIDPPVLIRTVSLAHVHDDPQQLLRLTQGKKTKGDKQGEARQVTLHLCIRIQIGWCCNLIFQIVHKLLLETKMYLFKYMPTCQNITNNYRLKNWKLKQCPSWFLDLSASVHCPCHLLPIFICVLAAVARMPNLNSNYHSMTFYRGGKSIWVTQTVVVAEGSFRYLNLLCKQVEGFQLGQFVFCQQTK